MVSLRALGLAGWLACSASAAIPGLVIDNSDAARFSSWNSDLGQAVVLMYHGLDAAHGQDPENFETQMQHLADNGFSTITMDHLHAWITTGLPPLPPKPVVLTFDDVYLSVYTVAFPTLQSHGFTGINFAHTDYVGVPPGGPPPTSFDHADWDECREMEAAGVLITESHTRTHPQLDTLSTAQVSNEVWNSKLRIESEFPGKTCRHFAYPYGRFNAGVLALVAEAGYETAVTVVSGPVTRSEDLLQINRYGVNPSTPISTFTSFLSNADEGPAWASSTSGSGFEGADYQMFPAGPGQAVARWTFTPAQTGTFTVSLRYPTVAGSATNAPFTVAHDGGETQLEVDQSQGGGAWLSLGDFAFTGGETYSVQLTNAADGAVLADAIGLTQVGVPAGIVLFGEH